jgi:hypothetical protein
VVAELVEHPSSRRKKAEPPPPLAFLRPSEFPSSEVADPEFIVRDLIEVGGMTLLGGKRDTGKTYLCQQLQVACATGEPWIGYPVKACNSFAIYAEDYDDNLLRRQGRICRHYNVNEWALEDRVTWQSKSSGVRRPHLFTCKTFAADGEPTGLWSQVAEHIERFEVKLLILDSIRLLSGVRRDNPDQIESFLRFLDIEAHERRIAIMLLCNPPKYNLDPAAWYSGPQSIEDTIRCGLSFGHPDTYDPATPAEGVDERQLIVKKANNLPHNHPFKLTGIPLRWEGGILVGREPVQQSPRLVLSELERIDLDARVWQAVHNMIKGGYGPFARDERLLASFPRLMAKQRAWQHVLPHLPASVSRLVEAGRFDVVSVAGRAVIRPPHLRYPAEKPILAVAAE